jgi:hypothetical protein
MKIYNEVVTRFNDLTGQWETISEDSFEYGGPMAMAAGMPPNASQINTSDTIADTIKTTAGYFTNGDGTLEGNIVYTGSLSNSNEKYYFNVNNAHPTSASSETQFSVTFGHSGGSGSDCYGDGATVNTIIGETRAIYSQLTNLLLEETEVSGGFKMSAAGSQGKQNSANEKDHYVYALIGKRNRFKDRINKKAWTLRLSGSKSDGTGAQVLHLTDDSQQVAAVATPGGPRYSIVSGTLGVPSQSNAAASRTFGWFYPEMGIMLFSGIELSASINGVSQSGTGIAAAGGGANVAGMTASFSDIRPGQVHPAASNFVSSSGFAPNLYDKGNPKNALRFINCMRHNNASTTLRLRSEEDQTQENYFCRIKATEYNFSANPTFVSGSKNKIRNLDMHGNPQTFITGVGLYNSAGQLLAIAKLSSPLKKNFASEATIKVKLTY